MVGKRKDEVVNRKDKRKAVSRVENNTILDE